MQRSKSVGDAFGGQKRLTKSQWEAVRRIEKFLRAWTEVSHITPELMGRTSGKVESLEASLTELICGFMCRMKPIRVSDLAFLQWPRT